MELHQGFRGLAAILNTRYGVGVLRASTPAVSWAVDLRTKQVGSAAARRELSALNRRRHRLGYPLAYA